MRHSLAALVVLARLAVAPIGDAEDQSDDFGFGAFEPERTPCLSDEDRLFIQRTLAVNSQALSSAGLLLIRPSQVVELEWPLRAVGSARQDFDVHAITNFVDLDPRYPGVLKDYQCGTRTYDRTSGYNHQGTDFVSWPFPWRWMDADEVHVVAGAPGTILFKSDGNFDESCSIASGRWNAVYVQHVDGSIAWYGHLKNGSLTTKRVGELVGAGEYLGVVGSSGISTIPHLHLELYDGTGKLTDPFDGPCNNRSSRSWWRAQRPYYDSGINRLQVGDAPVQFPACPGRTITNEVATLPRGTPGYFTVFYRDQLQGQLSQFRIKRPDGSVYRSWTHSSSVFHYSKSYWWWSRTIVPSEPPGTWSFEVLFQGQLYAHAFEVD